MTNSLAYNFQDLQVEFNLNTLARQQIEYLLALLLEINETTNLTAITNFQEALIKHIYDSLFILKWSQFNHVQKIIDIGSGPGFPALPLAICHPAKNFVMVEATQKKVNFQLLVSRKLNLINTSSIWARSEEIAHQKYHRQQYDLVLARAVASSAALAEITIPFASLNSYIVFYKGQEYQEELSQAQYAIELLGCRFIEVIPFQLPLELGRRTLIVFQKVHDTPSCYPRNPGVPQKKPLLKAISKH